jgi:putative ABC transport system permease protein
MMLFNYLLLAGRNIARQRGYALINTLGLSVGLVAALFILMYVRDELTFDTHHPHASQTYRIGWSITGPNGDHNAFPASPAGWDDYLKNKFACITQSASYTAEGMPTTVDYAAQNKKILTEDIIWAEENLFDILAVDMIQGGKDALKPVNGILLSETAAKDLFGDDDPMNKTLTISHRWVTDNKKIDMQVSGVYRDFPSNTHIHPRYVCNILSLKAVTPDLENMLKTAMGTGERNFWMSTLLVCTDESQLPAIQADLQDRTNEVVAFFNEPGVKAEPVLRKITDVHFDQSIDWSTSHKSANRKYLSIFITIALLILVVACINYINLATARSVTRAREIGLRKTFGGKRGQLFFQFMAESFLMVAAAMLLALLLGMVLLGPFNEVTGKHFSVAHLFSPGMLGMAAGITGVVTLLAGSYPALFVSGFQPAAVLKGRFSFRKGSNTFRQFLTTLQFSMAIMLLVGSVLVVQQMNLMRDSKLNEAGRQVLSIRYGGFSGPATDEQFGVFKERVLRDRDIQAMTLANHLPRLDYFGPINMEMQFPEISAEKRPWFQLNGDFDFAKTFQMKIIAGRDFNHALPTDTAAVLLNQCPGPYARNGHRKNHHPSGNSHPFWSARQHPAASKRSGHWCSGGFSLPLHAT